MKNILVAFYPTLSKIFYLYIPYNKYNIFLYTLITFFAANTLITNARLIIFVTMFFRLDVRFASFSFNTQLVVSHSLAIRALLFFTTES